MNGLVFIFIFSIQSVVRIFDQKTFRLNTEKNIEMLSKCLDESKNKEVLINNFRPLIKEICENYKLENDKEKGKYIYNDKELRLPYISKVHDELKRFSYNISNIGVEKCSNLVYFFSKLEKEIILDSFDKILFFLKEIKYKEQVSDEFSDEFSEKFFRKYIKDFEKFKSNFRKIDIKDWCISLSAFRNETKQSVLNKFQILKEIISLKKQNDLDFDNIKFEFEFLQMNFKTTANYILYSKYKTSAQVKSKNICEMKNYTIKLVENNVLRKKIIDVIKSMNELESKASEADDFNFKLTNDSNNNMESANNLYKIAFKKFIQRLSDFYSECNNTHITNYKTNRDYSIDILAKILEFHLDIKKNFKIKVDDVFNEISSNFLFGNKQFEDIYNHEKIEDAEKFINFYYITDDLINSHFIPKSISYNKINKWNSELAKYLNYKMIFIYHIIELIDSCFDSNNVFKNIYNAIEEFKYLDILLHEFVPNCFIRPLYITFSMNFQNSEFNFENIDIDYTTIWELKNDFYTKMETLINYCNENKHCHLCNIIKPEQNCMSILFDILKIVADNVIEERDCYLSGWENNKEIPEYYKKIFTLADKFINYK